MTDASAQRLAGLDGLRALAILLVFLRHSAHVFLRAQDIDPPQSPLWNLMLNGWIGVDLFFILSGYLITASLLRSERHDWKIYAQKRVLRIVPAYVGVLLLCVIGAFPLYVVPGGDLAWRVFYHLLFLQDYLPSNINVVFWSLGVEEKFYIIAPFLIFWLAAKNIQKTLPRILVYLSCLMAAGCALRMVSFYMSRPQSYLEFFSEVRAPFHGNWETILLGVAIAFWQIKKGVITGVKAQGLFYAGLAGTAGLMLSHNMMGQIGVFDAAVQPFIVAAFMGLMVFGIVGGYHAGLMESRIARFLSRISYSFYLVHFPLAPGTLYLWSVLGLGSFWLFVILYLAVSLAAATALHVALEKPFLDIKDRLGRTVPEGGKIAQK